MNGIQLNKLSMYHAVQVVLESNDAIWKPLAGFARAAADLDEVISSIESLAETQTAQNGDAIEKATMYNDLIDSAFEIAKGVRAYASANSEVELAAKLDYSRSDIVRGRESEVAARCRSILKEANAAVDELADYGITPAKLTVLQKRIAAFQSVQVKPRQGKAKRSAATKALPELFEAGDKLLNEQLDGLVVQFQKTNVAFYNEYTTARVIVDLAATRPAKVPVQLDTVPLAKAA